MVPLALLAAVAGGVVAVQACSSPSCQAGTLLLHIALLDQSPLADTIIVSGDDPNAAVMNTFAHTPDPVGAAASIEHFDVVVRWPSYYPAGNSVNLTVRALANGTQLGINTATIDLAPGCTESSILVSNRGELPDADFSN
jgi:hypothetical protein